MINGVAAGEPEPAPVTQARAGFRLEIGVGEQGFGEFLHAGLAANRNPRLP